MDKKLLQEYVDACGLLKETEQDLIRLSKRHGYEEEGLLLAEEALLKERRDRAQRVKTDVEAFLNAIPIRMQRIIRFKLMFGLSWDQTAARMGGGATAESLKKEFQRFLKRF